jgi:hypothetical protein
MIGRPKTLSAYEEFLSPLDMEYLKHALDMEVLKSKNVQVEITKETDFYTDTQRFVVSWASRQSPSKKQFAAQDLESLCQMISAIHTMEQ